MNQLLKKIIRGNGHNHYVIEPEDKAEFLAAGFVLAGTVTEDAVTRFVVRQKADYERSDIDSSSRPDNFYSWYADPTGDRVGQLEVAEPSLPHDEGRSAEETGSVATSDADSGV